MSLDNVDNCFIDLSKFGKGIVFVNQTNIGLFWEAGPTLSLYISSVFLKVGRNELLFLRQKVSMNQK